MYVSAITLKPSPLRLSISFAPLRSERLFGVRMLFQLPDLHLSFTKKVSVSITLICLSFTPQCAIIGFPHRFLFLTQILTNTHNSTFFLNTLSLQDLSAVFGEFYDISTLVGLIHVEIRFFLVLLSQKVNIDRIYTRVYKTLPRNWLCDWEP